MHNFPKQSKRLIKLSLNENNYKMKRKLYVCQTMRNLHE